MLLYGRQTGGAGQKQWPETKATHTLSELQLWSENKNRSQVGDFLSDLLSRSQNTGDANSLIIERNELVPIPSHRQSHLVGYGWGESPGILWRLKKKKDLHLFRLALAYFV